MEFRPAPTPADLKINVFLYGPPKSGKTLGAASAHGPILYLNADLPNATMLAHRFYGDKIQEVKFKGLQTLQEIMALLRAQEKSGNREIETVVVDPVGELHRRLLEEQSRRAVRPSRDAYGDVSTYIERFCRDLCERDVNVVIVAHERPVETGEVIEKLPWTGTKNTALGSSIMSMVDVIGYTGIIEREDGSQVYAAALQSGNGRRGGDRFAVLGKMQPLNIARWQELSQDLPDELPQESGETEPAEEPEKEPVAA